MITCSSKHILSINITIIHSYKHMIMNKIHNCVSFQTHHNELKVALMCSFEQIRWSYEVKWYLCIVTNTCLCFKAIIAIARISEGVIIDHKISNCVYLYAHTYDLPCKLCLIPNTSVCLMVRILCSSIYSWVRSTIACSLKLIIRTSIRFF